MTTILWTEYESEMRAAVEAHLTRAAWHRQFGLDAFADKIEADVQACVRLHKRGCPGTALKMIREMRV